MLYKNILSKEHYDGLVTMVSAKDFPWYFQPNIAYVNDPDLAKDPNLLQSFGLTHTVWDIEKGQVSEVLDFMGPLVKNFSEMAGIQINNFLRIKINLQTPVVGNAPDKYNGAHVDRYLPHKAAIYYLNDSDGDTFIFNEVYDPADEETWPNKMSMPTVKERITPESNSLYFLDTAFRYHSSSNPIKSNVRYTINFNFN
jgi:hypothetical protein